MFKNMYGKWLDFAEILFDVIVINVLFVIFSVPLITIFPSLLAAIKASKDALINRGEVHKNFFNYFKEELPLNILLSINSSMLIFLNIIIYRYLFLTGNIIFIFVATLLFYEAAIFIAGLIIVRISNKKQSFMKIYIDAFILGHLNMHRILLVYILLLSNVIIIYFINWLSIVMFGGSIFIINIMKFRWRTNYEKINNRKK